MDPRRLLIFRSVARTGSISAAARDLGWTQPAVSQHLQQLERQAGVPLLIRGARGITLTEAGAVLLVRADAVAGQLHMASEEMAGLAQLRGGVVRLVAFPSAAAVLVPPALESMQRQFEAVQVRLVEAEPPQAAALIAAGEADLAVVFGHGGPPPDQVDVKWTGLQVEPVHLVLPPGHRLARCRAVELAEFAEDVWIGGCVRCREHLVFCCRQSGFEPRLQHESDDYVVVQNLVARGLGVTMLPATALAAFRHPQVVVRDSTALGERHIGLVHRPGAELVPATAALIRELVAGVGSVSP